MASRAATGANYPRGHIRRSKAVPYGTYDVARDRGLVKNEEMRDVARNWRNWRLNPPNPRYLLYLPASL